MKKRELIVFGVLLALAIVAVLLIAIFIKNSIVLTVLSTLIGSGITFLITQIYILSKYRLTQFSGYYRDEIFSRAEPNKIIKCDKFQLIEKDGNILSGDFSRYQSNEPKDKNKLSHWKCSGFIVLDQLLLAYRANKDTTPSRGVIIVKLNTERPNGLLPCFSGKYYKFEGNNIIDHTINLIKIEKEEYDKLGV